MKIKDEEININDLIDDRYMHNKINNIYLNKYQEQVLSQYGINYKNCSGVKELLFLIEEIIDDIPDAEDLENISKEISEFDYYNNTNK
jgi:hypothetical protein